MAVTDECLLLFGNGDGGGGPTSLMLEKVGVGEAELTQDSPMAGDLKQEHRST